MACEGDFGVTLESIFAYDDDFVATLGSLLAFRAALGPIWHYFGFTLGAPAACGGDFGGTLGSGLGQFGVSLGSVSGQFGYRWMTLGHLMVTLQSLWIHLGYMKVLSQKTPIFPTYFNDFIKLFGGLWVDLRLLWGRFWRMKVNLGPLWRHLGITFGM